jgi:hypothetical protein
MIRAVNSVSQSLDFEATDGLGHSLLGALAADLAPIYYSQAGPHDKVEIALVDLPLITSPWTSGGVKERGVGFYRLDLPNALFTVPNQYTIIGGNVNLAIIAPKLDVIGNPGGAAVVIPPSAPNQTTGYFYAFKDGSPIEGIDFFASVAEASRDVPAEAYANTPIKVTSDVAGFVPFTNLFKGVTYRFKGPNGKGVLRNIPLTAGDSFEIPSFIWAE